MRPARTFPLARPLRGFLHWREAVCRAPGDLIPRECRVVTPADEFQPTATSKSKNSSGRRGLLGGGNWIIDQVKLIDVYPQREQLANILSQSQGTGGAPYNVLIDLARLGANFPLQGAGLVGKDSLGQFILDDCKKHKIDIRHLRSTGEAQTSFTDVMTEQSNGKRTLF